MCVHFFQALDGSLGTFRNGRNETRVSRAGAHTPLGAHPKALTRDSFERLRIDRGNGLRQFQKHARAGGRYAHRMKRETRSTGRSFRTAGARIKPPIKRSD